MVEGVGAVWSECNEERPKPDRWCTLAEDASIATQVQGP